MTRRSVFLGLVALIAATTNGVHSPLSVESDVYAALLDSIGLKPIPDTLLVGDSSLQFRAPAGGIASWRTQFDSIPSELPRRLEVASQSRIPSLALALPRPARARRKTTGGQQSDSAQLHSHNIYYGKLSRIVQKIQDVTARTHPACCVIYRLFRNGRRSGGRGDAHPSPRPSSD